MTVFSYSIGVIAKEKSPTADTMRLFVCVFNSLFFAIPAFRLIHPMDKAKISTKDLPLLSSSLLLLL